MPTTENINNKIKEFWPKDGPPNNEIEKWVLDAKMKWVEEHKQDREVLIATCGMNIFEINEYHAKRKEVRDDRFN